MSALAMPVITTMGAPRFARGPGRLFRAVGPRDLDRAFPVGPCDAQAPGIAADLAVLHERAADVWFDIDLDELAAIRAGD